jgi:hypothetical protein
VVPAFAARTRGPSLTGGLKNKAAGLDKHEPAAETRPSKSDRRWNALASVNGSAAQTFDFVLEVQLAALELVDGQIVGRGMLLGFGNFAFQSSVPQLKFRKMRLYGHRQDLLMSDWA